MIERIIEGSIRNRFLVLAIAAALTVAGVFAVLNTPVDAVPDLSENQVIVFTDWLGRSPQEIEDQVTYPLSRKLQGLFGIKAVRSSSEFNFSMITLIFDDSVDYYFARQRVTEKLAQAATFLPPGVLPYMAPDATALGQIYWYTVESSPTNPIEPERLWALNKFYIAQQLNAVPGVADVATVGGAPLEYQIDVRPEALRAYGITLGELYAAVEKSNMPAGGGVIQKNNAEYIVRGVGWIKDRQDIENTVIKEVAGTPIYVGTIATVQLGVQFRRSVYEKDGNEVVGGAVLMRHHENPLSVTRAVKEKIQEMQSGLPKGVHVVAAYDRTRLIGGAIHTLTEVMWHEMVIASVAILLILVHFRSVFVICVTLPLAVLFSFLLMWVLRAAGIIDIQANIMSLAGITISIGILVDQAIVMTENATHGLKAHFGERKVTGDIRDLVIPACRMVGRPIFFSVMIMLISFVPVFMLAGREGKLFHPLAFTKSFALLGVALISVTVVPALIPTFLKGHLRSEEDNWIVRSFINIYKPLLTWALPRRNLVMWLFAALLVLAAGVFPLEALLGYGANEVAWKWCFLGAFALVTSLTVAFTTGRGGDNAKHLTYACLLLAIVGLAVWIGAHLESIVWFIALAGAQIHPGVYPALMAGAVIIALTWLLGVMIAVPLLLLFFGAIRTGHVVLWRSVALVSLVFLALWAYHFPKIGVTFMPPLDEGTTLDMPITVPRASVTQVADDLKARDALLRGFPEIESVIGKAGRADTPTDPAPLDMVETFVNFRPHELWPKRVLRFDDAQRQVRDVLARLEAEDVVIAPEHAEDRENLVTEATQGALTRYDETMRELAELRYREFEGELGPRLVRFAVAETVDQVRGAASFSWPDGMDEETTIDELAKRLAPQYAHWLARQPALEDAGALARDVAQALRDRGAISPQADALEPRPSTWAKLSGAVAQALGAPRTIFAALLLARIEARRMELWRERVEQVNWELFDHGTQAFTWYALEEMAKAADREKMLSPTSRGDEARRFATAATNVQLGQSTDGNAFQPFVALREDLEKPFAGRAFFWPRTKRELVDDEMERVLQVPGWSNIFTQPIINRINMLSTGVRTDVGVKVFGPDLDTIDRACKQIEAALKPVPGARDVLASPIMGKGYLQIDIDREQAARYGISIEDIQNEIEVALGGRAITYTVEQRDRFPVRIRYARSSREDEESIRRLLVSAGGPAAAGMAGRNVAAETMTGQSSSARTSPDVGGAHAAAPAHASRGRALIPLSAVANIRIVEGPSMIKSEDGRLLNYVTLNIRGRDMVGFVDEAQRVVAAKVKLPEGVHVQWSGEFEHQRRAARTLRLVFPAVIALIFVILYLTYNDLADAGLMMLAVPEALAGGAFFLFVFPKITQGWDAPPVDFSVAVWVGFIACFGMATETGIIMLVYLRDAIEKRGGLENINSLEELRQAVIEGAVHRLRPKLLTEGVAIMAIFPMVFARGVGGEILAPMALPVLGGLLISDEVVDLFLPVRFYWVRRARWLKSHGKTSAESAESTEMAPAAGS
jgi:Cu/Ag efflux pump CusA